MLRLFTRMHLAHRAPPPANTQNSGFGSGAGGRGAETGRWGGRSGRGPSAWRPAAAANAAGTKDHEGSSEMVGSEADDDDGDELERALGRSLDVLAAEVRQPGCVTP